MKKYTLMAVMTVSMLVWNCKPEEELVENELKPKPSAARATSLPKWDLTLGGEYNDELTAGVALSDGGMILTGWTDSKIPNSSSVGIDMTGNTNFWIADLGADGAIRKQLVYGCSGNDVAQSVVRAFTDGFGSLYGGYMVGGYSNSPKSSPYKSENRVGDPFTGAATNDYWIVRFTADHKKIYDKTFGSGGDDKLKKIVPTSDGGYLLAGTSAYGPAWDPFGQPVGNRTAPTLGMQDYWVVKLDAYGNKLWDKAYGGSQNDILSDAIATTDGGFLLVGHSSAGGGNRTAPQVKSGFKDLWVIKIDASGNRVWDSAYGTGANSCTNPSVTAARDGGFLLAATREPNPNIVYGPVTYDSQYYLVKIDSRGYSTWTQTIKSNAASFVSSVVTDGVGNFIVAGASAASAQYDKSEPSRGIGDTDYWFIKLNSSGKKTDDRTYGGSEMDSSPKALLLASGSLVVAGTSRSTVSGDKQTPNKGGSDIWVLRIN